MPEDVEKLDIKLLLILLDGECIEQAISFRFLLAWVHLQPGQMRGCTKTAKFMRANQQLPLENDRLTRLGDGCNEHLPMLTMRRQIRLSWEVTAERGKFA